MSCSIILTLYGSPKWNISSVTWDKRDHWERTSRGYTPVAQWSLEHLIAYIAWRFQFSHKRKRKRSGSVLWRKPLNTNKTNWQHENTNKTSNDYTAIADRLRKTSLSYNGYQPCHSPQQQCNQTRHDMNIVYNTNIRGAFSIFCPFAFKAKSTALIFVECITFHQTSLLDDWCAQSFSWFHRP